MIRYFDPALSQGGEQPGDYKASLSVEFLIDMGINAEPLLALLRDRGVSGTLTYDDLLHQKIVFAAKTLRWTENSGPLQPVASFRRLKI